MAKFSFSRRDREFGDLFKPRGKAPVQGLYQKPDLFPVRQPQELIPPDGESPDYSVSDVRSPRSNIGDRVITTFRDMGLLSDLYNIATSLGNTRKERYREYDLMEESVLIASFLEMLSDDAFQRDAEREASVWVKDCEYREEIEKFLRDIDIESVGWGWMYTFIKYGDLFVKPEVENEKGIQWVRDDVHPSDVWRIELNGKLVGFAMAESSYTGYSAPYTGGESSIGRVMDRDSMVHFMFNYRPLYERVKISIPKSMFKNQEMITALKEKQVKSLITEKEYDATGQLVGENEKTYTFSVSAKYGSSALFNVRKDYKILNLEEQALALGRLARSAVARVFYVNTTGTNPKQRTEIMQYIEAKFSKKKSFNKAEDLFKSEYSPLNYLDDIFIPVTGDVGDVKVEQIGGDLNIRDIVDIDFFLNKVFSGLRTPKSFLGFEESAGQHVRVVFVDGSSEEIGTMAMNEDAYIGKTILTCGSDGEVVATKILGVRKTNENVEMWRVHLDNDKFVDFTPDHLFMMRDGSFRKVRDLQPGDSLMPCYMEKATSGWEKGYWKIKNNRTRRWETIHRLVARSFYGPLPECKIVHHVDGNRENNDIQNLQVLTDAEHRVAHKGAIERAMKYGRSPHVVAQKDYSFTQTDEFKQKISEAMKGRKYSEEHRQHISEGTRGKPKPWNRGDNNAMADPEIRQRQKDGVQRSIEEGRTWTNHVTLMPEEDKQAHMEKMRKARWDKLTPEEREEAQDRQSNFATRVIEKVCDRCGKVFNSHVSYAGHRGWCRGEKNNHKVVLVEKLEGLQDSYDLLVESENHVFPLEAGIFVHNSLPGSLGNTTLVRLDIRYARMVKKLQRAFLEGLKELIRIHIKFKFGVPLEDDDIPLQMVTISGAEESDRINTLKEKIDAANAVLGFVSSAQGDTRSVAKVLYDRFLALNFTDADGNILEGKDVFAKDFTAVEGEEYSTPEYTPSIETPGGGPVPGEGQSEAPELSTSMASGSDFESEPSEADFGEEG